jgi:hypothetical protein
MNGDAYRAFLALLNRLDREKIAYTLSHSRDEAITIHVAVPGERWEIELVDYGDEFHWEVERFRSNGHLDDESAIEELFAIHVEPNEEPVASHDPASRE